MNKHLVFHYVSKVMLIGAALYVIPAIVSLCFHEYREAVVFLLVGAGVAILSLPLTFIHPPKKQPMFARDGMVIAAMLWILFSVFGALPLFFSGAIPNFWDALFESASGFSTTGATTLDDVDSLPNGIQFWRCFSHWIGGMGVIVLTIAILPSSSNALSLMRAECAGPDVGKIAPKGKNSAIYLYIIYGALTLITMILFWAGGMPFFDSICHAMSIAGTGGFSTHCEGLAFYNSAYIEGVATVMMICFGINFTLYYFILIRRFRDIRKNTEIRVYFCALAIATILIGANIFSQYESIGKTFRATVFQVAAIMTSTGLVTEDFNVWPMFSQVIILILMFIGGCAGSTGGGFKVQRVVMLWKSAKVSIQKMIHPNSVTIVKSDGKILSTDSVHGVMRYLIIYLGVIAASMILLSLQNLDFTTTFTAVFTCVNNIGPGLSSVGPMENFSCFSAPAKVLLSFDMLLGRLECMPILILLLPSSWRKDF